MRSAKLVIEMVLRRQRRGSGSSMESLRKRTARVLYHDMSHVLGQVPWCVVGAVATRLDMPERATADLDIAVAESDLDVVEERLVAADYHKAGPLSIGGPSWIGPDGSDLDVLSLREPWAAEAIRLAQNNRDAQGLPIIPLPSLVVMKIATGRMQDATDIARMLGQATEQQLAEVRAAVRRWRTPEDMGDVEGLIRAGKWELESGL